jgi:hypothetical protein
MNYRSTKHGEVTLLGASLAQFSCEWDELNRQLFSSHPLFDSRFVNLLLQYFGTGKERLLRLSDGDIPCGMTIIQPTNFGGWQSFLPSQLQASALLFKRGCAANDILSTMPLSATRLDLLSVDPLYSTLDYSLDSENFSIRHALTMSIELAGTFDDYWFSRSKGLRDNLARYQRRLERDGFDLSFRCYEAPDDMKDAVARYSQLETRGWKGDLGTAVSEKNGQQLFYADVLMAFAITGQAFVMELWIGDQLGASRLFIKNDQMIVCLKTTFDEELKAYSLGRILLKMAINELYSRVPGGYIEFYTDATADQLSWATHHRFIEHKTLYLGEYSRVAMQGGRLLLDYFQKSSKAVKYWKNYSVASYSSLDELPESAISLLCQVEQQSVEFGLTWFRNFLAKVRNPEGVPKFYVLEREKTVIAILPVLIYQKARRVEQLGNYYTSLYAPALNTDAGSGELQLLLKAITSEFPEIVEFFFMPLDSDSKESAHLRDSLQRLGWISFGFSCFGNWYLPVLLGWDDYFASRNAIVKRTATRMERKFYKAGGNVEFCFSGDRLEDSINAYLTVYAKSWKVPEPYPEFMPGLIREMSSIGSLRMAVAWLGEQPVASQVWIVHHNKASIFKLAYDENYSEYSPGTILTTQLLKYVMAVDQVKEIDYLIGDDPYKKRWMSHRRERRGLVAYNPTSIIGIGRMVIELIGRSFKHLHRKFKSQISFGKYNR